MDAGSVRALILVVCLFLTVSGVGTAVTAGDTALAPQLENETEVATDDAPVEEETEPETTTTADTEIETDIVTATPTETDEVVETETPTDAVTETEPETETETETEAETETATDDSAPEETSEDVTDDVTTTAVTETETETTPDTETEAVTEEATTDDVSTVVDEALTETATRTEVDETTEDTAAVVESETQTSPTPTPAGNEASETTVEDASGAVGNESVDQPDDETATEEPTAATVNVTEAAEDTADEGGETVSETVENTANTSENATDQIDDSAGDAANSTVNATETEFPDADSVTERVQNGTDDAVGSVEETADSASSEVGNATGEGNDTALENVGNATTESLDAVDGADESPTETATDDDTTSPVGNASGASEGTTANEGPTSTAVAASRTATEATAVATETDGVDAERPVDSAGPGADDSTDDARNRQRTTEAHADTIEAEGLPAPDTGNVSLAIGLDGSGVDGNERHQSSAGPEAAARSGSTDTPPDPEADPDDDSFRTPPDSVPSGPDPSLTAGAGLLTLMTAFASARLSEHSAVVPPGPAGHTLRSAATRVRAEFHRFVFPGYSRHDSSDPLEHDGRQALFETIEESPGANLTTIVAESDMPESTVRYHLRVLEYEEYVTTAKVRGRRRFFPPRERNTELAAALKEESAVQVLEALAAHEPTTVTSLAETVDRDPSTVSHHLHRLADADLVERKRGDGPAVLNSLSPAAREALSATIDEADGHGPIEATDD